MTEPHSIKKDPPAEAIARLLVVDDDALEADLLRDRLVGLKHEVEVVPDGGAALQRLREGGVDLVLLDIVMPGRDGFEVLREMKADPGLREVPVIMIAGLDDLNSVARCIEIGADDYLPKPFKPVLLLARINACLEKKRLREQEQATYGALVESQKHLAAELAEAANYVQSLLPEAMVEGPVTTEWRFVPSTQLGGDSFGHHWLDDDHLAMYLLDVCGHGVGAALLSISAMNVLRSHALPEVDFRDPGQVLSGLNEAFQMEKHNNMYFTIWYGVFHRPSRMIRHGRGGHPPAILLTGPSEAEARPVELKAPGMVIGSIPGVPYKTLEQEVGPFARLFLFSDGVYEIMRPDGSMWEWEAFVTSLLRPVEAGQSELDRLRDDARAIQATEVFEDDFSIVKFDFE